ncbi:MAG: protein kinase [Candidatus Aminicenantes bacterium]|nr:protein kinase [Candidatus Aminicenantes bacterium]
MIGKTISQYKIIDKLGEGGMGVVYKAEDTKLKRTVALKFLPPDLTRDLEARERFIQEAQAAAALDHPNICTVYEINESDGDTYIAMAYVEGKSLKDKMKGGPLVWDEALGFVSQVAQALRAAHKKGIIHRDIKPANIMISNEGIAKILDFGLAKLSWGEDLTKTAAVMGTAAYMSPEQASGQEVDQQTDIWSLGCVLYETLTGKRPFKSANIQSAIYAILKDEPEPVSHLRKDVPLELEKILNTCLQKDPRNRYKDIEALLEDFKLLGAMDKTLTMPSLNKEEAPPSIAVLPFVNMSNDPEQEYFCDGLAEELINSLTKIKDIKVVARTSAFVFKDENIDVREIGRKLNVEKILEGSVRKSGNKLRITAQLINVADGFHLWSEKFDRDMEDIFAIQDEISLAIVNNLKVTLLKGEEKALLKRYTEDPEAYILYLKGIYNLRRYTAEGFQAAIKYLELTLQKDPDYALAYSGLSEVFYAISYWGNVPPHQAYPKVKEFAKKAIEMDKDIGEAHASLGMVYTFYDWNWKKAKQELSMALELNPSSAIIHLSYSWFLTLTEQHEEAIAKAKRAQELDPLSPLIISHIGLACIWGCHYDKAIQEMKAGMILAPDFYLMHYYLGLAYRAKQMRKENIAEFERAVELSGGAPWPALMLASNYFETDQIEKGEKLLGSLEKRVQLEYMPSLGFAYIYFFRNDLDKTYYWLARACEERDNFLPWCAIIPIEEYQLHNHPRLRPLYKKYGLIK